MTGLYEGVTTVTDASEVDYSSPLYNQESTEMMDEGFEEIYVGTERPEIPEGAELLYDVEDTESFDAEAVFDTEVAE